MRRYHLLMRIFPRWWRQRYGDDLLRVLSDDPDAGTLRPSVDLVRSGLIERTRQFERLVWSGVRFARGRVVALGAGLMVAAVAFSLLTASVDVGTAHISGIVKHNWRGAYDLLVLPPGGNSVATPGHLVQANYLSQATGGITTAQWHDVATSPGVAVAAPLEIVGYVLETVTIPINLTSVVGPSGAAVFALRSQFVADNGLSKYPAQEAGYVYVTPDRLSSFQINQQLQLFGQNERLPNGQQVTVCPDALNQRPQATSPFDTTAASQSGSCDSRLQPGPVSGYVAWSFPVLVAGIDPGAEAALTGLRGAVTSGRYLGETQAPAVQPGQMQVPVLASDTSFDGDEDTVTVSALPPGAVAAARSEDPAWIAAALQGSGQHPVMRITVTGAQAWRQLVAQLTPAPPGATNSQADDSQPFTPIVGQYWSGGRVAYHVQPNGQIDALPVSNPDSVWTSGISIVGRNYVYAPPAAQDVGFRTLTEHVVQPGPKGRLENVTLQAIGKFDPDRLTGFSAIGASPLASYQAPVLTGANRASRQALHNAGLNLDGNMAGYAQQPPLLLTTLAAANALENPDVFSGNVGQAAAPIGSIRVRVGGLRGTVEEQLGKVAAVAAEIHHRTGLAVVVTAGSSSQLATIGLPAGRFGRPSLQLSEGWTAVMVALVILHRADDESVALFVLVLVVCALFLSGAALAGVRSRREEVAVLRALGWARRQVFALILGEVAMLGLLAGVAGVAVSFVLVQGAGLSVPWWRSLLVLPVALVLAIFSGLLPAMLGAWTEPAATIRRTGRAPRRPGWQIRSVTGMALVGVTRSLGRSVLAAAGLAAAVAGLSVLLAAEASFSRSIGDSALAGLVTASTRGADLASVLLAVGLGAAAVADQTYLSLRERAAELAALEATGWDRRDLTRLLLTEAAAVALAGSLIGAAVGLAAAGYAFGVSPVVAVAAAGAAVGGTAAAVAVTLVVLTLAHAASLTAALASDE